MDTAVAMINTTLPGIAMNAVTVSIGLVVVLFVILLNRKLGGKIKLALWFFLFGVFADMAAILSEFFGHTYTLGGVTFDVHVFFMAVGMVFFAISAYRFSLLVPRD